MAGARPSESGSPNRGGAGIVAVPWTRGGGIMRLLVALGRFVARTFAIWVLVFSGAAYLWPQAFTPLAPHIFWMLGMAMFGMGLTLKLADFRAVASRPREVAIGIAAHFTLMPLIAFALTQVIPMPSEVAAGVILVGCCPCGTAGNVMTYLAKGDTALSVTITACTTLLAPLATPGLVWLLARAYLPVDAVAMASSVVQVIVLPIVLGLVVQRFFPKATTAAVPLLPGVSVLVIVLIIAGVVAVNQPKLAQSGLLILVVVALHNGFGLALGYAVARAAGMDAAQRRAVSIVTGMENSGLGAALAQAHFSPLAAVPGAVFSVWHNISGAMLGACFRRADEKRNSNGS